MWEIFAGEYLAAGPVSLLDHQHPR